VVVISHDDKYYHVGDRIIKLDDGKLSFDKSVVIDVEPIPYLIPVAIA